MHLPQPGRRRARRVSLFFYSQLKQVTELLKEKWSPEQMVEIFNAMYHHD
jgi:hypothetical protein